MTNIDDVAKLAKVSRSTVSRVLTGSALVKSETRTRVMKAIDKLNYSPNSSARSLASKRNKTIGVVCGYMFNDLFYSKISHEIYNACNKRGYGVFYCINQTNRESQ